jgi:hypothetical protein
MKVLVTAKRGQLTSEFEALKGFDPNWTFLSEKDLDITNKTLVLIYINSYNFNLVINCASYTTVDKAEDKKELAYKAKDISLADWGSKEIELAETEMPGLMALREEYAYEQPLKDVRIAGCLHMTIQTDFKFDSIYHRSYC